MIPSRWVRLTLLPMVLVVAATALAAGPRSMAAPETPGTRAASPPAPEDDPVLTLAESLELALEHSPRLAAAQSRLRQSHAQEAQAGSILRPRLDATGSVSEQKTPPEMLQPATVVVPCPSGDAGQACLATVPPLTTQESITSGQVGLTYSQVLLPVGETRVQLDLASLGPEMAASQEARDQVTVLAQVEDAYLGVLEAEASLASSRLMERNAAEAARVARDRLQAGTATELDVQAAETGARRASQGRQAAEDGLRLAWRALYQVMGLPLPERLPRLEPVREPPEEALPLGADLDALRDQAREGRPEVIQARLALEQARLQLQQAERQRRPSLALQASYQPEDGSDALTVALDDRVAFRASVTHNESDVAPPGQEAWQVGLQLSWNLADGGSASAGVRAAQEGVTQAELALQELEAGIALELAQRHAAFTQAMLDAATAQRDVSEAAGRLDRVRQQAEAGAAARLQVWEAEADVARARQQEVRALAGLARARTELMVAAGVSPDRLVEILSAHGGGG